MNLKEPANRGHPIRKVVYMLYVRGVCGEPDSVLSPQLQGLFVVLFCAICSALFWNMLVSLAEYILFYRALLQKRTMFLGSLRIVAIP